MSGEGPLPFQIRCFRPEDAPACRLLYVEGLLGGRLVDADKGADIEDISGAYMSTAGNRMFVAVIPGEADGGCERVVGMVGVQQRQPGVGEIRRLRVDVGYRRRGIGSALMEAALRFCEENQYLKITLDTFMEREPAVQLFKKFHFHPNRTRKVGDKELVYFYLDLYGKHQRA